MGMTYNMSTSSFIYALHRAGVYGFLDRSRDYAALVKAGHRQSFSQYGEDLFLRDYFGERQGFYIEVGGNHPFSLSNTYLLYRSGWRGLVVEPIQRLCAKHKRFRPRDIQVNAAASDEAGDLTLFEMIPSVLSTCDPNEAKTILSSGSARLFKEYTVPVTTVAELYRAHLAPHPISVLSIDTEGHDLAVLRGVGLEAMRPEIIVCEANDESKRSEVSQFLGRHRYRFLKALGCNLIFSTN